MPGFGLKMRGSPGPSYSSTAVEEPFLIEKHNHKIIVFLGTMKGSYIFYMYMNQMKKEKKNKNGEEDQADTWIDQLVHQVARVTDVIYT